MIRRLILTLAMLATFVAPALAHTMVRSVSIADGATLKTSPRDITIIFEHAAKFGSVQLRTAAGERIPVAYVAPKAATTTFSIPLPQLAPDRYRITWRVIADDGHVMTGAVSFKVAAP